MRKSNLSIKSFSIVVETENLGMATINDLKACLDSLKKQTWNIRRAEEVLVIAGTHISNELQNRLKKMYPWISIQKTKEALDYISVKIEGAKMATGDIVVFVDSDATYERGWLSDILGVFSSHPDAGLIAGLTSPKINSNYTMSLGLAWMFLLKTPTNKPKETSQFTFNNFAIKRTLLLNFKFPKNFPFYRGKGTIIRKRLIKDGVKMYRAPKAKGYHAVPSNFTDWWYRMLINGHDFIAMADFSVNGNKIIEKRSILKRFRNLMLWVGWKTVEIFINGYRIIREDKKKIRYLPLGLPIAFANVLVLTLGGIITCVTRDYLFNKINRYEAHNVV
jgi:GT2 family glycosyltransferase